MQSSEPIEIANHVYRAGEGVPLVLINAFPVDHRMWDECADRIIELGHGRGMAEFPVWAPDMAGCGASPVPQAGQYGETDEKGSYPQALDAMTEGYAALLKDAGYAKAVWVGLSMGGYVALDMQRRHPEAVAGIALCDTTASRDGDEGDGRRSVAAKALEGSTVAPVLHFAQPGEGDSTIKKSPEFCRKMAGWINEQSPAGVAWRQRMAAGRPDLNDQLPLISTPAMVLGGTNDPASSPEHMKDMAAHMTGTTCPATIIENCGHFSAVEHPDDVANALLDLMARVQR